MKNLLYISCLLVFLCICHTLPGQQADTTKYKNLEPYDFHMKWLREGKSLLIDVREPFEYRRNRISDAINITAAELAAFADTIDRSCCMFFYCSTGYRSKKAAEIASDIGFVQVFNLDGGIVAWKKDGFPVEKKRRKGKG
jgi:rhodanese-related sulfurtransferase